MDCATDIASRSFAVAAVLDVANERPETTLAEVNSAAALQRRIDRTYLVTAGQLRRLGAAIGSDFRALEIGGQRLMGYESVYFDSADLELFRAHRQGRRRRFKVRVRTYLDSASSFIEVKTKSGRGETVKHRIPHPGPSDDPGLDAPASSYVRDVIREQYGVEVPALQQTLVSRYRRTTLVDLEAGERLTCDVGLTWTSPSGLEVSGPDKVLLESKTHGRGRVDDVLGQWGIRPLSMSKYALGVALLHPAAAANKWDRLLRREFGRHRAGAVVAGTDRGSCSRETRRR
ncbi:polyphosphate polymerase domain-containing protein [Flexivirga sp. B27]